MTKYVSAMGRCLVMALVISSWWCLSAAAQTAPSSVNPTAQSVKEKQLLDALKPPSLTGPTQAVSGRGSIPDAQSRNLIQPAGRDFRQFHQGALPSIAAYSILGMLAVIVLFFLARGRIRLANGFSGETVVRFGSIERFAHWTAAVSFILLGLTGLNLTFGKSVLLPLLGESTFASLSQFGKFVHNYVSFAFVFGIASMLVLWIKDNFIHPRDITWLAQGGGLVGRAHPPAGRFNFGQKVIFWATILGGAGLSISGYVLMFPFQFTDISGMQVAGMVHGLLGAILVAIIIAHIYIGTLGMEGAFSAMGTGEVDVNWAKEHHSVWADKQTAARGSGGAAAPAE